MTRHDRPRMLPRGCLGKLPRFPEFIRVNAGLREVNQLDACLEEGLFGLHRVFGHGWEPILEQRLYHRFVFRAEGAAHTLLGLVWASTDSRGRFFPFTLYHVIPTAWLDHHPLWLPAVADRLYGGLEEAAVILGQLGESSALSSFVEQPLAMPLEAHSHARRYAGFLDELTCAELELREEEEGAPVLQALVQTLPGLVGGARGLSQALALPLRQPRYAWSLEIQFWIELILLLLKAFPLPLSLFWPAGLEGEARGTLWLGVRAPDRSLLEALLREDGASAGSWVPGGGRPMPGVEPQRGRAGPRRLEGGLRGLLTGLQRDYPTGCAWNQGE